MHTVMHALKRVAIFMAAMMATIVPCIDCINVTILTVELLHVFVASVAPNVTAGAVVRQHMDVKP